MILIRAWERGNKCSEHLMDRGNVTSGEARKRKTPASSQRLSSKLRDVTAEVEETGRSRLWSCLTVDDLTLNFLSSWPVLI